MKFGVFDHLDRYDAPLAHFYEDRLGIIELYDRLGFHCFHLAEHHATPLGMAPSPMVFLSAVAQRTKRLRFGPMVLALPLHHPVRVAEEICMLDHLSGGRLDIGFGRGSSPVELTYYGVDTAKAQALYADALEIVLKAIAQPELSHQSPNFSFDRVPREIEPFQQPHPPLWYGVHSIESSIRAAERGLNTVNLDETSAAVDATRAYIAVWQEKTPSRIMPLVGLARFIVVAETDATAQAAAARAYPAWHASFTHLNRAHGRVAAHPRPADFETLQRRGQGIAGSPATVQRILTDQITASGANYIVGQFAFGDLTPAECRRSIELFAAEVMPAFV
jgi:alkanesulfonate monooxygenase SsuD/methylene tetrahydromethanopterin reductase-like flavin-dependent oxidoreductase (luciferase family)